MKQPHISTTYATACNPTSTQLATTGASADFMYLIINTFILSQQALEHLSH